MTGIKIEMEFDPTTAGGLVDFTFYHRQPDVGWVLDGGLSEVVKEDAAEESKAALDVLYTENIGGG